MLSDGAFSQIATKQLDQPDELKYWTRALKVSEEEIRTAITQVENYAAAVRKELGDVRKEH